MEAALGRRNIKSSQCRPTPKAAVVPPADRLPQRTNRPRFICLQIAKKACICRHSCYTVAVSRGMGLFPHSRDIFTSYPAPRTLSGNAVVLVGGPTHVTEEVSNESARSPPCNVLAGRNPGLSPGQTACSRPLGDVRPNYPSGFLPGTRVVLLADAPAMGEDLRAGRAGTILCCDANDCTGSILVSWDLWTGGQDDESRCVTGPDRSVSPPARRPGSILKPSGSAGPSTESEF